MKVDTLLLAILLASAAICGKGCKNNCYLGGSFFSLPLDSKRCCRKDLHIPNCEFYSQILNSMVCYRCELGFQWSNNECVKFGELPNENNGKSSFADYLVIIIMEECSGSYRFCILK